MRAGSAGSFPLASACGCANHPGEMKGDATGNLPRKSYFPKEDRYWTRTLEAAQSMIAPGDAVCAHEYFQEFFPGALPYLSLDEGKFGALDWIIFHKDAIRHPGPAVMRRVGEHFTPLFANEVFVLFASARAAGRVARRDFHPAHVEALWMMVDQFEKKSPARPPGEKGIVQTIKELAADPSRWPREVMPSEEAGIVISACSRLFKELHANLANIRARGCALPVDVWHLPGEFTARQIAALSAMANFTEAGDTPFGGLSGRHEVHGFKAWMLARSRFRRTLMLDVNSFPLTDLAAVFASGEDCILWQDTPMGWCYETSLQLRRALGIPARPLEFESGQLYVDKKSAGVRDALRLAAALNTIGRPLYDYTHGDKETYSIACDLLGVPFSIAPGPGIEAHGQSDLAVTQPWLDGSPLFYHAMGAKAEWSRFGGEWAALEKRAADAEAACA